MICHFMQFVRTAFGISCTLRTRKFFKITLAVILVGCCSTGIASAAVTVGATSQQFGTVGATSLVFTHTLGAGTNRLVVCSVQIANPTTAVANVNPTVTYAGITMNAIPASQAPTPAQSNTSKIESEMFYLTDSSLGTISGSVPVTVSLPSTPTGGIGASCTSFFGLVQGAPQTATTAYSGNNAAQTATLTTSTAGDLIIDSFAGGFNLGSTGKSASPSSPQIQLSNGQLVSGGILGGTSYEIASAAGSVTVGWAPINVSRLAYSVAAFAAAKTGYTVSTAVNPVGAGTVTLSPNQTSYDPGSSVTVTATPVAGYAFVSFSGDLSGTTNPATLLVDGDKSLTANFALTQTMCALTVTFIGQGTVSPASGSYPCGTTINLIATPASGYSFSSWSGGGYSGTNSSASFTLSRGHHRNCHL